MFWVLKFVEGAEKLKEATETMNIAEPAGHVTRTRPQVSLNDNRNVPAIEAQIKALFWRLNAHSGRLNRADVALGHSATPLRGGGGL